MDATKEGIGRANRVGNDVHIRGGLGESTEEHVSLQPSECRAEAVMGSVAEGQMVGRSALCPNAIRVDPFSRVPVG